MRTFLLASLTCLALLAPKAARAGYHAWDINEIYSNPDGTVQFIELRALSAGQQFLSGAVTIRATNSIVTNSFVCNSNLPADTTGRTCIFGTANLASIPGGVTPNYVIPPNFIPPTLALGNGAVLFLPAGFPGNNVAAVYSGLPTNGDSAIVRSGGSFIVAPTNSPRNYNNQSNTIVPVKFLSATKANGDFVMSFRTATGVNGSAGPNYAVQFNDALGGPSWITLSNLTGNGATRLVSNSLSEATNRLFRLRVP